MAAGGASRQRKVRAPQDRMPANGRASRGDGKCNRKQTATAQAGVRVKRRGKSSPRSWRHGRHGKPHPVQDPIGQPQDGPSDGVLPQGRRQGCRVGRSRRAATRVPDGWPSRALLRKAHETEPGLQVRFPWEKKERGAKGIFLLLAHFPNSRQIPHFSGS